MSVQTIFERLCKAGCTATGALALMGNWQCESGNESCRVQGDFQLDRRKSSDYANTIDRGLISDDQWCRDGRGWGLAQWTFWSRKDALLQFCRRRGVSVANEAAQVDFAISELKSGYHTVWADLTTCKDEDLYKVVELVCKKYEQPAYNNVQQRANAAVELRSKLTGQTVTTEPEAEKFWPPRMICEGMNGPDVEAGQAILKARGYLLTGSAGVFSASTRKAVEKFQREHPPLDIDGVIGPMTWTELLKM